MFHMLGLSLDFSLPIFRQQVFHNKTRNNTIVFAA
jgi:hypothetical protein